MTPKQVLQRVGFAVLVHMVLTWIVLVPGKHTDVFFGMTALMDFLVMRKLTELERRL